MRTRLQFEQTDRSWLARSTQTRAAVGTLEWSSRRRRYVLWTSSSVVLDEQQLEELLCFVRARTAERAAARPGKVRF